jgi:hypothetical protein
VRDEDKMAHYLFIVSRQHQALYDHLLERFADDPSAEVVLDRRQRERRERKIPSTLDRRRADRRQRPEVDEDLWQRAVVIVTIP